MKSTMKTTVVMLLLLLCTTASASAAASKGRISHTASPSHKAPAHNSPSHGASHKVAPPKAQPQAPEGGVYNVSAFQARGDGVTDDTNAFLAAWKAACKSRSSTLVVPSQTYLVSSIVFQGPCQPNMTLQVDGTIVAPADPSKWPSESREAWIQITNAKNFTLQGTSSSAFDGSGSAWWSISCKHNHAKDCNHKAPTVVKFVDSTDITVRDVQFRNSQQMNLAFLNSQKVLVSNIRVQNPPTSPNTDGIHLEHTGNVVIEHSDIGTGDDCVSIGPGSSGITIKNIVCGPGHGISIGSLGKGNSTALVSNVFVRNAVLHGTTNGLRIKTWQGGSGSASDMRFEDVQMYEVANPIIIDQFYCDSTKECLPQKSAVQVSNIAFFNISGTSKTPVATIFNCSHSRPCLNITLKNIDLKLMSQKDAASYCNNAFGSGDGYVRPQNCLKVA